MKMVWEYNEFLTTVLLKIEVIWHVNTVSLSTVPSVLKSPWSFRMWGTVYPKAQCNIPGQ